MVKKAPLRMLAIALAVLLSALLMIGVLAVLFCAEAWCPAYSLAKIRRVTDFASCEELRFPVAPTHPPRCAAGQRMFYSGSGARLRIIAPLDHAVAALPLSITGEVRVFSGAALRSSLFDQDGFALVQDRMTLPKALSGQIVPFRASLSYPRPMGTGGTLIVELPISGGSPERVSIPVAFAPLAAVEIKAFFGNRERDPLAAACDVAYPVARRVSIAEDLPAAALRELLHGPTLTEQRQAFFTNLPSGVTVRSLTIAEGRASVVFSRGLEEGVGGSCRVQAIRSQIERTFKQFPHVTDVEISVEGSASGEVLQP